MNKKMKALYFSNAPAIYQRYFLNSLKNTFSKVEIYFDVAKESFRKASNDVLSDGLEYNYLNSPGIKLLQKKLGYERVIYIPYKILFILIRKRPDSVFVSENGIRFIFVVFMRIFLKFKIVNLVDAGFDFNSHLKSTPLKKLMYNNVDLFICFTKSSYKYYSQHGNAKLMLYWEPVNKYRKFKILDKRSTISYNFLYVGNNWKAKGIQYIPMLLNAIKDKFKVKSHISIYGFKRNELDQKLKILFDKIDADFKGFLPFNEIELENYDFVLIPSQKETWCYVANESVYSNLPILISMNTGFSLFLPDDLKFDPENPQSLLDLIENYPFKKYYQFRNKMINHDYDARFKKIAAKYFLR